MLRIITDLDFVTPPGGVEFAYPRQIGFRCEDVKEVLEAEEKTDHSIILRKDDERYIVARPVIDVVLWLTMEEIFLDDFKSFRVVPKTNADTVINTGDEMVQHPPD